MTIANRIKDNSSLVVLGLVLIGIAGVGYYFYKKGKQEPTIGDVPEDTGGSGTTSSGMTDDALQRLAGDIRRDCIGINVFANHDTDLYEVALSLSNRDFVRLYNMFNLMYQSQYEETMRQVIESQWAMPYSPFESLKESMSMRFDSLNLP